MSNVDWDKVTLSAITHTPHNGDARGCRVAVELLGANVIIEAVEKYVSNSFDSLEKREAIRMFLKIIASEEAVTHCKNIYQNKENAREYKFWAIELLGTIGNNQTLSWIYQCLEDPDEEIQGIGSMVISNLYKNGIVSNAEIEPLVEKMLKHKHHSVIHNAKELLPFLDQCQN